MNDVSRDEVRRHIDYSEDELLAELGAELVGRQALPLQPAELADRGRRWLSAQREYLQDLVCNNQQMKDFAIAESDEVNIAIEVAKLVASAVLPVNPIPLAVLLAKKGLKSFCATNWSTKP
jgi:hypothetical protein